MLDNNYSSNTYSLQIAAFSYFATLTSADFLSLHRELLRCVCTSWDQTQEMPHTISLQGKEKKESAWIN